MLAASVSASAYFLPGLNYVPSNGGVIGGWSGKKNKVRDRIRPPVVRAVGLTKMEGKGNRSSAALPMSSSRKQKRASNTKHNSLINPVP